MTIPGRQEIVPSPFGHLESNIPYGWRLEHVNTYRSYITYINNNLLELPHFFCCLLIFFSLGNCATVTAQVADGVHDQGNYTIPLPLGWRAGGSGGHSFYQSDSGGCFNYIDQENSESLARLCTSEQPWEDVPARGRQAVGQFGQGLQHEVRTTPNGAVYHTLSKRGGVAFIFLEGRDYFLNIEIEAHGRRQNEVATRIAAILDQVVWSPVAPGRRRLKVDETTGAGSAVVKDKDPKVDDAVAMLCEGKVFDTDLLVKAIQHRQLDLTTKCPADGRLLIEILAFTPGSEWPKVLSLVTGKQRQMLLNLRLAAIAATLLNDGPEDTILEQLDALASAGAQPVTIRGAIDSSVLNTFLIWEHSAAEDAGQTDEAINVLLKLLDNLSAVNSSPPDLGYQFWKTLLANDTLHPYPDQKWQLLVLARLHQRFGTIAPTGKDEVSPLQYAISSAPLPVVQAVAQLTRSDAVSAGVISAAIERDRWEILAELRKIDLRQLSDNDYQSVLVTATRKVLASGDVDYLRRLLSARKAKDSSLDWLLNVTLNAYQEEFASFGWKTVEYLQQAGASPERLMADAGDSVDDPCSYMLYYPERFRGLVERGFDIGTQLPVSGRRDLKVNTLMLFLMCRDPRRSLPINEELGEVLVQHAQPEVLNTYSPATKVFPLALAAGRSPKLATMMLDAGADPNAHDAHGNTMLMMEAAGNELATVNFLLSAGAEVNSKNDIGINALGYAECLDAEEARAVLTPLSKKAEGVEVCREFVARSEAHSTTAAAKAQ